MPNWADKLRSVLLNPMALVRRRPTQIHHGFSFGHHVRFDKLPPFRLFTAEVMRHDPQVAFGLAVRNGPLLSLEVEVTSEDKKVAEWVKTEWDRIWHTSAHILLRTKVHGYAAHEVMYREKKSGPFAGFVSFARFNEQHPLTVVALVKNQKPVGFKPISSVLLATAEQLADKSGRVLAPKALWLTFDQHYGNPYGFSIMLKSYSPWWEKWQEHGTVDLRRLRFIKDAWMGMVVRYPGVIERLPDGTEITAKDLMREVAETFQSGGVIALPSTKDGRGNNKYDIEAPKDTSQGSTVILDYGDRVNAEIWKGLDLPQEVIESQMAGGFSGRAIPFIAFLSLLEMEARGIISDIDRDILRPVAHLNFGREPEYEIKAVSLVDQFTSEMSQGELSPEESGQQQRPGAPGANGRGRGSPFPNQQLGGRFQFQEGERKRAPVGGVSIGGKQFRGGEFIPTEVLERATPEEMAAIEGEPSRRRDEDLVVVSGLESIVGKTVGEVRDEVTENVSRVAQQAGLNPNQMAGQLGLEDEGQLVEVSTALKLAGFESFGDAARGSGFDDWPSLLAAAKRRVQPPAAAGGPRAPPGLVDVLQGRGLQFSDFQFAEPEGPESVDPEIDQLTDTAANAGKAAVAEVKKRVMDLLQNGRSDHRKRGSD